MQFAGEFGMTPRREAMLCLIAPQFGWLRSFGIPMDLKPILNALLQLAEKTGAHVQVVSLFASFHDSQRVNASSDPQHGPKLRPVHSPECAGPIPPELDYGVVLASAWRQVL